MKNPTKAQIKRYEKILEHGCMVCRRPAVIHHIRTALGMSQRNHNMTIPLCPDHHNCTNDSIHLDPLGFKERYGTELEMLDKINRVIK